MEVRELPENVPEMPEPGGGFPVQPDGGEGPLPPPRPVKASAWSIAVNTTLVVAGVAAGLVVLSMATPSRTLGSTRSYHLKYEQRQQQVAAAAQDEAPASPEVPAEAR